VPDLYRPVRIPTETPAAGWTYESAPVAARRKLTILAGVETRLHLTLLGSRGVPVDLTGLGVTQQLRLRVQRKPIEGEDRPFDLLAVPEPTTGPNAARFSFTARATRRAMLDGFEFGFYEVVLIRGADPATATYEAVVPLSPFQLQKGLTSP